MFDVGKFGSSFCGGPLNGFDAMVMSECEKPKPSKSDISYMAHFFFFYNYLTPEALANYTYDVIHVAFTSFS